MRKKLFSSLAVFTFVITGVTIPMYSASETGMTRSDYFSPAETAHYFWNGVYDYQLVHNQGSHTISNHTYYNGAGAISESGFYEQDGTHHYDKGTTSSGTATSYISYNNYWVNGTYQRSTSK